MPVYPGDIATPLPVGPKDPYSTVDYVFDWSDWLGTDTISSTDWTVPSGLTEVSTSNTEQTCTIWLSGGTAGTTYTIVNEIVTDGGRTEHRSMSLAVAER